MVCIGVATSIAASRGYDPLFAAEWAATHRFDLLQVYLTDQRASDRVLLRALARVTGAAAMTCLVHAAEPLTGACRERFATTIRAAHVLAEDGDALLVLHANPETSLQKAMQGALLMKAENIVPAIENYSRPGTGRNDFAYYLDLLKLLCHHGVPHLAVLDLPRYFNQADLAWAAGWAALRRTISHLAANRTGIILHLIDTTSTQQSDRTAWCSLGEGILPLKDALMALLENGVHMIAAILEYEAPDSCLASRATLAQWLGGFTPS
ncbi:hypothetical protein JW905_03100 [bacterium]|nr:hypothetical protein [candidate division CSSED10-310 bacterium]